MISIWFLTLIQELEHGTVRPQRSQSKSHWQGIHPRGFDGLSLAVAPGGGKSWHFRYQWFGKQKRMSLGTYPELSLRDARIIRDEARALLAKGTNPHAHRKHKRATARLTNEYTFKAVFLKWLAHRGLTFEEGRQTTQSLIPRIFANDVLPLLGKRSIYEIRRVDLLEVIGNIERRKALSVAEKVRTWFNQMFRYALMVVPGLEQNPASDLDVVAQPLPPETTTRSCACPSYRSTCNACVSTAAGCGRSWDCDC